MYALGGTLSISHLIPPTRSGQQLEEGSDFIAPPQSQCPSWNVQLGRWKLLYIHGLPFGLISWGAQRIIPLVMKSATSSFSLKAKKVWKKHLNKWTIEYLKLHKWMIKKKQAFYRLNTWNCTRICLFSYKFMIKNNERERTAFFRHIIWLRLCCEHFVM